MQRRQAGSEKPRRRDDAVPRLAPPSETASGLEAAALVAVAVVVGDLIRRDGPGVARPDAADVRARGDERGESRELWHHWQAQEKLTANMGVYKMCSPHNELCTNVVNKMQNQPISNAESTINLKMLQKAICWLIGLMTLTLRQYVAWPSWCDLAIIWTFRQRHVPAGIFDIYLKASSKTKQVHSRYVVPHQWCSSTDSITENYIYTAVNIFTWMYTTEHDSHSYIC